MFYMLQIMYIIIHLFVDVPLRVSKHLSALVQTNKTCLSMAVQYNVSCSFRSHSQAVSHNYGRQVRSLATSYHNLIHHWVYTSIPDIPGTSDTTVCAPAAE